MSVKLPEPHPMDTPLKPGEYWDHIADVEIDEKEMAEGIAKVKAREAAKKSGKK